MQSRAVSSPKWLFLQRLKAANRADSATGAWPEDRPNRQPVDGDRAVPRQHPDTSNYGFDWLCADRSSLKRNALWCAELDLLPTRRVRSLTDLSNGSEGGQCARRRPGPPARDSQRRKPWLPATRRGRGRYRAGCSGDERAPEAPCPGDSSALGPTTRGEKLTRANRGRS